MGNKRRNIVVFRFSAMGDVALTVPVLQQVISQNPDLDIFIVTRKNFKPFFENQKNIYFLAADFKGNHKGLIGLIRLYKQISIIKPETIIDLHQNLRTLFLKFLLIISCIKTKTIFKGRSQKRQLTNNKLFRPLLTTIERYQNVFINAGYLNLNQDTKINFPVFNNSESDINVIEQWLIENKLNNKSLIGFAPFAQHITKMWPIEKYQELFEKIKNNNEVLVFGGGVQEHQIVENSLNSGAINIIGLFSLSQELYLMSKLKVMVSGDSSNMHLAALMGTNVISIWGSTHYYAGFGPLNQPLDNIVEIPKLELPCRPCSVYGNKPCYRKDLACLNRIEAKSIIEKINKFSL